jgi:hypothetical protein
VQIPFLMEWTKLCSRLFYIRQFPADITCVSNTANSSKQLPTSENYIYKLTTHRFSWSFCYNSGIIGHDFPLQIIIIIIENRYNYFFFVSWGGVRLSPLSTPATNWPIVPTPNNIWWIWSSGYNENCRGKPKYSEKTCPSAISSTTHLTWPGLEPGPPLWEAGDWPGM